MLQEEKLLKLTSKENIFLTETNWGCDDLGVFVMGRIGYFCSVGRIG